MYAQGGAGGGQSDADGPGSSGASQPTAAAGDQDYTAQWAAYYRAYGMEKEAQQIEEVARNSKQVCCQGELFSGLTEISIVGWKSRQWL